MENGWVFLPFLIFVWNTLDTAQNASCLLLGLAGQFTPEWSQSVKVEHTFIPAFLSFNPVKRVMLFPFCN